MTENFARNLSDILSYIVLSGILVLMGFQIAEVNETPYSEIIGFLFFYSTIGSIAMRVKNIYPPATLRLKQGSVDLSWGFRVQYWSLWWPTYLMRK